jgi:protein-L-isoaspartate(D-aspartate) O-methyltransferase
LLTGPSRDLPTGVRVTADEVWEGLGLWVTLHEAGFFNLTSEGEAAGPDSIVPYLQGVAGRIRLTAGLINGESICALTRSPDHSPPEPNSPNDEQPFELFLRVFGPGEELAQRLMGQIMAWDAAGRPGTEDLHVRAYPLNTEFTSSPDEVVIRKRWMNLVFGWK